MLRDDSVRGVIYFSCGVDGGERRRNFEIMDVVLVGRQDLAHVGDDVIYKLVGSVQGIFMQSFFG